MIIFEFKTVGGRGALTDYLKRLDGGDRGRLRTVLDTILKSTERDLPTGMLKGPYRRKGQSFPKLYKLRVSGPTKEMRIFCEVRRPPEKDEELTILFGAVEKDRELEPRDAPEQGERRRLLIESGSATRVEWESER